MKIALVHDYLREYGGAERVIETLHKMWPEAPLYTSFVDWISLGNQAYRFKSWDIRTAPLFLIPGIKDPPIPGIRELQDWVLRKFHSPLRFLAPWIWNSFDLSGYDVVISSSGWFMCRGVSVGNGLGRAEVGAPWFSRRQGPDPRLLHKGFLAKAVTPLETSHLPARSRSPLHICYIHHPPRNLYGYATGSSLQKYWPVRVYATVVNFFLRKYDWDSAQRVDYFIANSKETARRVEKFYRRESAVIYPPITQGSTLRMQGTSLRKRDYYLSVGRLTYSKRVDVAIEACNKLKLPLKIVGAGKEEQFLRSIAGPTIEFLGSVSDSELAGLYAGAKALIFCALDEDFGMVPVEAMVHGVPVIALAQGGVLETVIDGKTGILFQKPLAESLVIALGKFDKLGKDWDADCRRQAEKFSTRRFKTELISFVAKHYAEIGHSHR